MSMACMSSLPSACAERSAHAMEYTSAPLLEPRTAILTLRLPGPEPAEQFQFRAVLEKEGTEIHPAILQANQGMQQMTGLAFGSVGRGEPGWVAFRRANAGPTGRGGEGRSDRRRARAARQGDRAPAPGERKLGRGAPDGQGPHADPEMDCALRNRRRGLASDQGVKRCSPKAQARARTPFSLTRSWRRGHARTARPRRGLRAGPRSSRTPADRSAVTFREGSGPGLPCLLPSQPRSAPRARRARAAPPSPARAPIRD